jgi:hypothetical protein
MKTLEDTLVKDEIVTKSGRVFRPGNKELLENIHLAISVFYAIIK